MITIAYIMGILSTLFVASITGFIYLWTHRAKPVPEEPKRNVKTVEEQYNDMLNYQPRGTYGQYAEESLD